jgi:hypothetical protein
MAKSGEKTRLLDGLQGVSALIAITLGVIPLIKYLKDIIEGCHYHDTSD